MEDVLIKKAQRGGHDAFLALLERYDRQIMSVIYRFTANLYDREDLYQEVFLHCFKSLKRFNFKSAFGTWLYRLALNRCLDYMKANPALEVAGHELEGPAPPEDLEDRARLKAIHGALSRLKGPQRICFHLYYVEAWSVDDIAAVLECREGTVKSNLNRAREFIRRDKEVMAWNAN